jgi:hypothetical protein
MVVGATVFSNPPMLGLIKPQPMLEGVGERRKDGCMEEIKRTRPTRRHAACKHFTEKILVDNTHNTSRRCREGIHTTNYDENLRFYCRH